MTRRPLALIFLAAACAAVLGFSRASPLQDSASFLVSRQQVDGGFAEQGRPSGAGLTSWVMLALDGAGRDLGSIRSSEGKTSIEYLRAQKTESATDLELKIVALATAGAPVADELAELEALRQPTGRIGPYVNSTIWGVLALRSAGRPAGAATLRYLLRAQRANGGWSWNTSSAPDSNDTAAAIQALRAAGLKPTARPVRRGLAFLRAFKNRDGGYGLGRGDPSDSQSTAWVIQALVAAKADPGKAPFRFLATMRRSDGSYRYSARYTATPVWVTSQVIMALARKPIVG